MNHLFPRRNLRIGWAVTGERRWTYSAITSKRPIRHGQADVTASHGPVTSSPISASRLTRVVNPRTSCVFRTRQRGLCREGLHTTAEGEGSGAASDRSAVSGRTEAIPHSRKKIFPEKFLSCEKWLKSESLKQGLETTGLGGAICWRGSRVLNEAPILILVPT